MYIKIKRIGDLFLAIVISIIMAIPMIILAISIKLEDRGPIIYKSKRIGKNLAPFEMYKFRSMKIQRKELECSLSHQEMTTQIGKFIRKTSLDELPQLFNILKGEMSFIGPRPWIPEYYEYFSKQQERRTEVLPGISGLAQVKGRNGIDIFEKIQYDIEYVEKISIISDLKIIVETIKEVFKETNADISENNIKEEIYQLKSDNKKNNIINK